MCKNNYDFYLAQFSQELPLGESFDLEERPISIGGVSGKLYFIDGLSDGQRLQLLFDFLMAVPPERMARMENADQFMEVLFPYIKSSAETDVSKAIKYLYSGLCPIILDGLDKIIVADVRKYPQRGVQEPEKEKTLRGAKDGFTENYMDNLGLIRRRIRDSRLICKNFVVGKASRTDVAVCYMKGLVEETLLAKILDGLQNIQLESVSVGDQTIVEQLVSNFHGSKLRGMLSPFPKVRYTQRPDIICAHLTEGKIAIVVDNSPTVVLLPVGVFDFTQNVDDYYFPLLTGNYLRLLRILNVLVILFLTPIYLLITEGDLPTPFDMDFMVPTEPYALPIFWQFLLLEISIDALKLASLNTPESLGTSLSVIGALILGEFSIDSGWFIPQTILMMAVVALAAFTQPSIELSYGIKLIRVMMLVGAMVLGVWGLLIGLALGILLLAATKTLSGRSYLYPLIPLHWKDLRKLLFRTAR